MDQLIEEDEPEENPSLLASDDGAEHLIHPRRSSRIDDKKKQKEAETAKFVIPPQPKQKKEGQRGQQIHIIPRGRMKQQTEMIMMPVHRKIIASKLFLMEKVFSILKTNTILIKSSNLLLTTNPL